MKNRKQIARYKIFFEEVSLPPTEQKEIFYKLVAERMNAIEKQQNSINIKILIYHYKRPTTNLKLNDFID